MFVLHSVPWVYQQYIQVHGLREALQNNTACVFSTRKELKFKIHSATTLFFVVYFNTFALLLSLHCANKRDLEGHGLKKEKQNKPEVPL